jgi:hypothetical protein
MPFISWAYYERLSAEKQYMLTQRNVALGVQPETQDMLYMPDNDRHAGTYMLGVQGVGKSSLLENMIAYDASVGNAVIVIDPHGDLTTHAIAQLPHHRLPHTYLLDMEDEAHPFGINPFNTGKLSSSVQATQAVERIMHIFEVLWAEVVTQAYLPRYVRAATMTLMSNPGATLVDMHRFLIDERFRAKLLKNVTDESVIDFWHTQYDNFNQTEQYRRVQALIGRLEALFMGRSLVRNIVGQRESSINFRRAIEQREIIFIHPPVKTLKQDARLVAIFLLSQIHQTVFSFADIPADKRPGISLYVDECQHFTTSDFAELFSEGRKFGIKITLAHQYRSQLPNYLRDSTMTARTKICFQLNPDDAREMAHVFPEQETTIRPEDMNAHPVEHLLTYGCDDPYVSTFIHTYLRPLQSQRRGYRVEIKDTGFSLTDTMFDMINGGRTDNPRVPDPTPYLDHLLYQVMRTGDYALSIPAEAVIGFSNCGRGFFQAARSLNHDTLEASARYPRHLVIQTDDGPRWTRKPDAGMEQLYHFLFHLRMTMVYIAAHPIGKESSASRTDVAAMLTNLPRRVAFVRSAETVGVVHTNNTPLEVAPPDLRYRLQAIRQQTRLKYCHPREDIEGGFILPEPQAPAVSKPAAMPVSRWEQP